ncbi:MAG: hypothetical protein K2N06_05610 [Oscillospiraceae bacterium]|nr:hypothetical protein [Oscillospiraceae bacterium]
MFTERELCDAIAECENAPSSLQNCQKLAVFYSLYDRLFAEKPEIEQKTAKSEVLPISSSNSEFLQAIAGRNWDSLLIILDELMDTVKILQPRLYAAVMQKLQE